MASQQYTYTLPSGKTLAGMIEAAERYLSFDEEMETQTLRGTDVNAVIIQARAKSGGIKQFVGMDKALTVRFLETGNTVTVEFGSAKWGDKAVVLTISLFLFWPLTVTSGYGIYKQKKLPENILKALNAYVNS